MSNTDYANVDAHLVNTGGGNFLTTVAAGSTVQLNAGTTIATKVIYLGASSNANVRFAVNSSVTVSLSAPLPTASVGDTSQAPLELAIDDPSKIWVFCSLAASVGCTYLH